MKQAAQEGKLNRDGMELVMREEKPQQNNITIKGKKLERYFPRDFTPAQKEERIIKALDPVSYTHLDVYKRQGISRNPL